MLDSFRIRLKRARRAAAQLGVPIPTAGNIMGVEPITINPQEPLPAFVGNGTVWEHTLDEYEKCILSGDTKGAAILRALILEKLKPSEPDNCGFCGKNLTECECPNPM